MVSFRFLMVLVLMPLVAVTAYGAKENASLSGPFHIESYTCSSENGQIVNLMNGMLKEGKFKHELNFKNNALEVVIQDQAGKCKATQSLKLAQNQNQIEVSAQKMTCSSGCPTCPGKEEFEGQKMKSAFQLKGNELTINKMDFVMLHAEGSVHNLICPNGSIGLKAQRISSGKAI